MRKNIILAAAAAASAILLTISCTKQELPGSIVESKIFTAVVDQGTTKTAIDGDYKVNWSSGDIININGALYSASPDESDATKAVFTYVSGTLPEAPYSAIYPASLRNEEGDLVFPATQAYESGKFNAPMYAESDTEDLLFKNICGVLCLSLKGTDKVKSITINAKEALCGAFSMTDATTVSLTGSGKSVTLDCGTGVQLSSEAFTNFYVYLPPKSYSAGMRIFITSTDGDCFWKNTTATANIERNNVYTLSWDIEFSPTLPGEFSVSANKQIQFSKGNLNATYDGSRYTWGFATKQNFRVGSGAGNTTIDNQTSGAVVDLFGWSTASTNYGISTSGNDSDYSGDFKDWGTAIDNKGTWRTLSNEEWTYLFGTSDQRRGKTKAGVTVDGQPGCTVIVPDDWDITSYPLQTEYSMASTPMTWEQAQAAGLVCFPTPSLRWGSNVPSYYNNFGWYWSSSDEYEHDSDAEDCAYCVAIDPSYDPFLGDYYAKSAGCAVRLVTDVK